MVQAALESFSAFPKLILRCNLRAKDSRFHILCQLRFSGEKKCCNISLPIFCHKCELRFSGEKKCFNISLSIFFHEWLTFHHFFLMKSLATLSQIPNLNRQKTSLEICPRWFVPDGCHFHSSKIHYQVV